MKHRFLLSTGILPYRFELSKVAEVARSAGIDGLEVVVNDRSLPELLRLAERGDALPAPILSLHAPYHHVRGWGTLARALLNTIELAPRVGADRVVFHPPTLFSLSPSFASLFYSTRNFQRLGNGTVLVSMENMPRHLLSKLPLFLTEPRALRAFLLERNLFLTLDCSHFASHGHALERAVPTFGDLITSVHLTNTSDCRLDEHLAPQHGCLDLCGFLSGLSTIRSQRPLYLVFEIDFGMARLDHIRETIARSREFVELAMTQG